jgi:hypothetical protein
VSAPPVLLDALRELQEVLDRQGLRWYVFGAQAVVVYGLPRLTADLDVTLEASLERALALLPLLEQRGFATRAPEPEDLLRRARVLTLAHRSSGMAVDLVVAGPGLEEEFLAHRRFVDLGGLEVPVISPEDLVVTKILAGRPKDLEDVRGVLREQSGRLDLQRSRRFLRLLEQALGRSDLLPVLDRLVEASSELPG